MSTPKLDQYNEAYSRLVSKMVELHNRNRDFVINTSRMAKTDIRKLLKELRTEAKEVWRLAQDVSDESAKLKLENAERKKIDKANAPPPVMGRPRKYPKPVLPPEEDGQA
jgi:post-segregation antitoxin (ccd killing protein)